MKSDLPLGKNESLSTDGGPIVRVASRVTGTGMSLPERVVTNQHFASYLDTTDEWIRERTGIAERRWAPPEMGVSELADPAARDAIASAGLTVDDIDAIVFATVTPDYVFPSSACVLQGRLGIKNGFAFDVNAVCSGFLYAVVVADSLIASGQCRNALVVGADIYSRIINPQDRTTCVLFGDGAGAIVLSAVEGPNGERAVTGSVRSTRGVYGSMLKSDGSQGEILWVPQGSAKPVTPERLVAGECFLQMAGREVFKLAVRSLVDVSHDLLKRTGLEVGDVNHFVSHQANKRILMAMAKNLDVPESRVPNNVEKYGNTSAASLPILLAESARNGTIKAGDLVLLSAFGGGVTWGACLVRW